LTLATASVRTVLGRDHADVKKQPRPAGRGIKKPLKRAVRIVVIANEVKQSSIVYNRSWQNSVSQVLSTLGNYLALPEIRKIAALRS
jgi:hypothetical protein